MELDNKKLALIIGAIVVLVVAFLVVRFVIMDGEKTEKGTAGEEFKGTDNPAEVFEEPPTDIKPPALPG